MSRLLWSGIRGRAPGVGRSVSNGFGDVLNKRVNDKDRLTLSKKGGFSVYGQCTPLTVWWSSLPLPRPFRRKDLGSDQGTQNPSPRTNEGYRL